MKKQILVAMLLMVSAASAMAQGSQSFTLTARIPFDFVIRGETLPAGVYILHVPGPTPGPMMVLQRVGKRGEIVLKMPVSETWTGPTQLTFHRLGDTYYFVEIADRRSGVQRVHLGARYREALKLASAQTVTVAAK